MKTGIVYYTDNRCEERIADVCRRQILRCTDLPIISVSHYPIDFGTNLIVDMKRGTSSLFNQILIGVKESDFDIVFLCEHDVLYHPSHFTCRPHNRKFSYNLNRWQLCWKTGRALFRHTRCTSLCVAFRDSIIKHYEALLNVIAAGNYHRSKHGFAPGTHRIQGVPKIGRNSFMSEVPCIDIRHATNYTPNRWRKEDYSKHSRGGWKEADEIPGWGRTKGRFDEFLREVDCRSYFKKRSN